MSEGALVRVTIQRQDMEFVPEIGFMPTAFSLVLANSIRLPPGTRLVIDAGAGCGILAITAARLGAPHIIAVESSDRACEIIRENCEKNGVAGRVEVINSRIEGFETGGAADLVVCNPPTMPPGPDVPHFAQGGGVDGLDFLRTVLKQTPHWLNRSGKLQLALSSLVPRSAVDSSLSTDGGFYLSVASFILPLRSFYSGCYSSDALTRMVAAGDIHRTAADELSEFVTIFEYSWIR